MVRRERRRSRKNQTWVLKATTKNIRRTAREQQLENDGSGELLIIA
jgi:hypothetical protein